MGNMVIYFSKVFGIGKFDFSIRLCKGEANPILGLDTEIDNDMGCFCLYLFRYGLEIELD